MATASEIIRAAYREAQIVAITALPTAAETTEALTRLNALVLSVFGNEVGSELSDIAIGGEFDQSSIVSQAVPDDARLILNLDGARTIPLDPRPYNGQRVAVADAGYTLDTANLTLDGNGRRIEAAATLTLATEGLSRQWMYRADTANWVRLSDLAIGDTMPFPTEFDDWFVIMLAMRLNPRHRSDGMSQESIAALDRQTTALQARYRKPRKQQDWGSLGLLGQRGRDLGSELL